jgi:penicillin-binding protein activator
VSISRRNEDNSIRYSTKSQQSPAIPPTRLRPRKVAAVSAVMVLLIVIVVLFEHVRNSGIDVNQKQHMDADYYPTDMKQMTQDVVSDILASKSIGNAPQPPIIMITEIQNRTQQSVDMKSFTDQVRSFLMQSGKVRFINEARREDLLKEQGYRTDNATPEVQKRTGQQLGADYLISGSVTEVSGTLPTQTPISQQLVYCKLTLAIMDLKSSELLWTKEHACVFTRKRSQPLFGW